MGASTYVIGIRKPDEKWLKYKKIMDTLEEAEMSWEDAPKEVLEFFGYERPDPDGISVILGSEYGGDFHFHECCSRHSADSQDGYIIDIEKLPKNITHIKVITSY